MQVISDEQFNGSGNVMVATLSGAGAAKLQARTRNQAGAIAWVDVPDGALVAPTCVSIVTTPETQYRFTGIAAGVVVDVT